MKRKIIGLICLLTLICTSFAFVISTYASEANNVIIPESNIPLKLWYSEEAPKINEFEGGYRDYDTSGADDDGWQQYSLPIGNGYFGANVFGRTETERIQISEKTLASKYQSISGSNKKYGGMNNFSETFIDFGHTNVSDYVRYLDLKTAISGVEYTSNGVKYSREYFTSYPDKALVIKLGADTNRKLSFTLRPTIPYEQSYMAVPDDGYAKSGTVISSVKDGVGYIELAGTLEFYDVDFLGIYKVYTDGGTVTASTTQHTYKDTDGTFVTDTDGTIVVNGATSAYIVITLGTDYELSSDVFTSDDNKKPTHSTTLADTRIKVESEMNAIDAQLVGKSFIDGYNVLKNNHIADYSELFGRVSLDFNCNPADFEITTDKLLEKYKSGYDSTYLEALVFQYGRYTLIASSRSGALPAHLQGAWNPYNTSPWGSGYWHNLNVQMNYWPAFSTNIAETFESYVEYNKAFLAQAKKQADDYISQNNPDADGNDGGNGWVVGTSTFPYRISIDASVGNLGFTTQMYWEYYNYTRELAALELVYDILVDAARYITKCVEIDENGKYLVQDCDSPEVHVNGVWYYTDGTTYAQTFAYLNNYHALEAAKKLGIDLTDSTLLSTEEYSILSTIMEQIDKYDPINVGLSGQIKEFREEDFYGSIGDDPNHRHLSQLVGLYPGNIINSTTPAWLDAATVTLDGRSLSNSVSWAYAHKTSLYARVKDGEEARERVDELLTRDTFPNLYTRLWGFYQADATYGITAGIAEMLLQSNSGYIEPLPAIPKSWSTGSYTGLVAAGNFEISAAWENGLAKTFNVKSNKGGTASVYYPSITDAHVVDSNGNTVNYTISGTNLISFETEVGKTYIIYGFKSVEAPNSPEQFSCAKNTSGTVNLTWSASSGASSYNVYKAVENAAYYTLIGSTSSTSFNYTPTAEEANARVTYAVTAVNEGESPRSLAYTYSDEVIETPYGTVTKDRVDGANFILFAKAKNAEKYQFFGTGTQFIVDGFDKARLNLKSGAEYYQGGTIVIYLLKDTTATGTASGAGWNAAPQIDGTVIVDLADHKLTVTAPRLIGFESKTGNNGYEFITNFEFKNGTICASKPLVEVFGNSEIYTGTKIVNIAFNNITLTPNGSSFTLFNARGSYTSTQKAEFNVEFTDCNLNYASLSNMTLINDACVKGSVVCNVSINGGTIKAKSFDDFTFTKGFAEEDYIIYKTGTNAKRTEFTVSYTHIAPTIPFNTDEGIKYLASAGIDNAVEEKSRTTLYRLSNIKTPYGYIPENQKDTAFSLFYNNLHISSHNNYSQAELKIKELLYPNASGIYIGQTLTLYMKKDYTHTYTPNGNYAQQDGTYVLDLGEHTLTMTTGGLFDVVGKAVNGKLYTTSAIIKNGTILIGESPLMILNSKGTSGNFNYDGTKPFTFIYENVIFDKNPSSSKYTPLISVSRFDETGTKNMSVSAIFNNCSFNSDNSLLFDLSISNFIDADISINGGTLTTDSIGTPAILKASDGDDKVTFGRPDDGKYTSFILPSGTETPCVSFNTGNLVLVKISENEKESVYRLTPKAIAELNFVPKTSLTLDRNLILNVYIPATSHLESFILDGVEYTDFTGLENANADEKEYYLVKISLDAKEAAREIVLAANVNLGEKTATGTFTFGIIKYAEKILSDGSNVEKMLVKDVLSYIRVAYVYFGINDANTIAKINAILGDAYDANNAPVIEGNANAETSGLKNATFVLDGEPTMRFYLEDGADASKYEFFIDGTRVKTETSKDSKYIDIGVYAYALCETVTYTVDGKEAGSFHINAYYEWSKTQNNDNLTNLVARFWKYCQSARDYKNSVVPE